MFESLQKIITAIATAVLSAISANFGVTDLNMTAPTPNPSLSPINQVDASPSIVVKSTPIIKKQTLPPATPWPTPNTATSQSKKINPISLVWKNVNDRATYTVDQSLPVEIEVTGTDVNKVEFSVGSDFHVCTVVKKPYTCILNLNTFLYGITGKQDFPIEAKVYQVNGEVLRKSIVIYVSPLAKRQII